MARAAFAESDSNLAALQQDLRYVFDMQGGYFIGSTLPSVAAAFKAYERLKNLESVPESPALREQFLKDLQAIRALHKDPEISERVREGFRHCEPLLRAYLPPDKDPIELLEAFWNRHGADITFIYDNVAKGNPVLAARLCGVTMAQRLNGLDRNYSKQRPSDYCITQTVFDRAMRLHRQEFISFGETLKMDAKVLLGAGKVSHANQLTMAAREFQEVSEALAEYRNPTSRAR